jgi:hypothetical protein
MKMKNKAVSEIIGTLLLLGLSISLFTVIYISVITLYPTSISPTVNLICTLEDDDVIIEHRGGKTLNLDTKIIVTIAGTNYRFTAGEFLNSKSKENGVWNVGEKIVYPAGDTTDFEVTISIVDIKSNSLIMVGVLQDGLTSADPFISTSYASEISNTSARVWMNYNFVRDSGSVRFTYKSSTGNWINTSWIDQSGAGSYDEIINNLSPETIYFFKAQLKNESDTFEGVEKSFTTKKFLSIDTEINFISPYYKDSSPLVITATGNSDYDNVTLYYRWSEDNISWGLSGEKTYDEPIIDNTASESNNEGSSSMSWTHTVSSGLNNSTLIVCTNVEEGTHDNYYVESVDFNGDALTRAVRAAADEGTAAVSEIWYLQNPDAGSNTVTVNFSQAVANALGGSVSFSNINQSTLFDTGTSIDTGSPTSISTSINTDTVKSLIIAVATDGQGTFTYSYGSSQNQIYNVASGTHEGAGSYVIFGSTGSFTMHTNLSGATNRMSQAVATWIPTYKIGGFGTNWEEWSNANNPDSESPWSWIFDFPNGQGYYEFYSIGSYDDEFEIAPINADAICYYNP